MTDTLQLYGFDCPFVERTRLLLGYKGLAYEYISMRDFNPRPQWFLDLNPQGKVPVLVHHQRAIYESTIINEYIEDVYPEPSALPEAAHERAFCRLLIDQCGQSLISSQFALLMNRDGDKAEPLMQEALASWRSLNEFLLRHCPGEDFAFGEIGMAEFSFIPFFSRYAALEYYRHFELPDTAEYQRARRWRDACLEHPVTEAVCMPRDHIIKLYYTHSQGWGMGRMPPKGEENSLDPSIPFDQRPMPPRPPLRYWEQGSP